MYLYPRSEIVKNRYLQSMYEEVDINNKNHASVKIWAFPENRISCLIPTLFLSLLFPYYFVSLLPRAGLLLGWSQNPTYKITWYLSFRV